MGHYLARAEDQPRHDHLKRFDPRYWTVDFSRPMMAAVTTPAPATLRVDTVFYRAGDLAGLIWDSVDRFDHPLLSYETRRDYRGLTLSFRWRSGGVQPLDAVYGPVLTIEGRDAAGGARTWYVRLWNYAQGTGQDARVTLDFDALASGFSLPGEAVFTGDIDRMFVSLAPPGYTGSISPLPTAAEGWAEMSAIVCEGGGAVLRVGDVWLPETGLSTASGYDDSYNLTPERLLSQMDALGYRAFLDHYVGMSHFARLAYDAASGRYLAGDVVAPLCAPAAAWHADLLRRAGALGLKTILSLSYELFDENCPDAWKQRDGTGAAAATGYMPPSTLLSPSSAAAMAWLQAVARAFAALAVGAGQEVHFQVGEPWWWVGPDRRPCIYDAAARAAYTAQTGRAVPTPMLDVGGALTTAQLEHLTWAGSELARSTGALVAAVKALAPGAKTYLLFFTPQVLNGNAAALERLNLPGGWAGQFDVLQLEDYDFVTEGNRGMARRALELAETKLGYARANQHYFAGFAHVAASAVQWERIAEAIEGGRARGVSRVFVWALPQILRDGFTYWAEGAAMQDFDDVVFPFELGSGAGLSARFNTQVVTLASGFETRNVGWAQARMRFDAGVGVRGEADAARLMAFFRERRGAAVAFRLRDPLDNSSAPGGGEPTAGDQPLGIGDGAVTRFALVKRYESGGAARRITRPVAGSVRVAVNGAPVSAWSAGPLGTIEFDTPPPPGAVVTAGFRFDVPVRFERDELDLMLGGAGAVGAREVALVEVREAA